MARTTPGGHPRARTGSNGLGAVCAAGDSDADADACELAHTGCGGVPALCSATDRGTLMGHGCGLMGMGVHNG